MRFLQGLGIFGRLTVLESKVATLQTQFAALTGKDGSMALDISKLQVAVNNETTVEQGAIVAMQGLTAEVQTLINNSGNTVDPVALQALVDEMTASQANLAKAIANVGIVRSLHFPKGAQPALLAPPPSNLLEIYSAALRDAALINEKLQELQANLAKAIANVPPPPSS